MEVKTFYKRQIDVANVLAEIIDAYLQNDIEENFMISSVNKIFINNKDKVVNAEGFTAVIKHKCGKRRLDIISKILKENN